MEKCVNDNELLVSGGRKGVSHRRTVPFFADCPKSLLLQLLPMQKARRNTVHATVSEKEGFWVSEVKTK